MSNYCIMQPNARLIIFYNTCKGSLKRKIILTASRSKWYSFDTGNRIHANRGACEDDATRGNACFDAVHRCRNRKTHERKTFLKKKREKTYGRG